MMKKLNKVQLAFLFVALLFPCALFAQPLKGLYAIGNAGAYISITQAINDLRIKGVDSVVVFELQSDYTSTNETFPIRIPLINGASAANTVTFRPASAAGLLTINSGTQTIFSFDSAKHVIIDGRAGGMGLTRMLHLRNTGPLNTAISFQNEACFNQLVYDSITVDSATAISFLATNVLVRGNDSNIIAYNSISSRINKTRYLIYASGSSYPIDLFNSENRIKGNLFSGFGQIVNDDTTRGIYIREGNTAWEIEENSFFQPTEILSNTTLCFVGIHLYVNARSSFTIRNNSIGGSSAFCGGSSFKMRGTTLGRPLSCYGIHITSPQSDDAYYITGNEISNFSLTSLTTNYVFKGIYRYVQGSGNSYNFISDNVIGSTDTARRIIITNTLSNTSGTISGIEVSSQINNSDLTITGNRIGGISSFVPSATGSRSNFRGISVVGTYTNTNVTNNVIGNANARNIFMERAYECAGIVVTNNTQVSSNTISDNVVRNIHLDKPFTNINGNSAAGIAANCPDPSSLKVNRNMIYSLSSRAFGTTSSPVYSLSGIYLTGGALTEVSQNQVYQLYNDSIKGHCPIYGMRISGTSPNGKPMINANMVRDLYSFNPSSVAITDSAIVYGIVSMNTNCINNTVRLGYDTSGNVVRSSTRFSGIVEVASSNSITAHNSVYIGGDSAYPMVSYAYYTINAVSGSTVANNIFVNTRSTVNTNKTYHYALGVVTKPGLKSRNNLFYVSGKSSATAQYRDSVYIDLATVSRNLNDSGSAFGNPNFINPTGKDTACNLRLASPTPAERSGIALAAVTFDADSNLRADLTPTDLGAYADTLTYTEAIPPTISFTPLTNTAFLTDRTLYAMIFDSSGILTNDSLKPRVYFRKGINGTWQYNGGTIDSGNVYSAKWSFVLPDTLVGGFSANDTIYYFIVAQDSSFLHNMTGAIGPDVRTINSAPVYLNSYRILQAFSGTYNVGTGQTFTSLTNTNGFFQRLAQGRVTGNIILRIKTDITETGANVLNKWTNEGPDKYTITIRPDSTIRRTISGNVSSALISISGAEGASIDGSFNGTGRHLLFRNINTTGRTILFNNGSRKDTIKNCVIEGRNFSSVSPGIICVEANSANSTDSLVIMNNLIRKDTTGAVPPDHLLRVTASSNRPNTNTHIINNEFDYGRYSAIFLSGNNALLYGNQIYQSIVETGSSVPGGYCGIQINGGDNITIRKNSIGGTMAMRGGVAMQPFKGIKFYGIVTSQNDHLNILIDSNEIGNIVADEFHGVEVYSKKGLIAVNKVGNGLNISDTIRSVYQTLMIYAKGTSASDTLDVKNNHIGNVVTDNNNISGFDIHGIRVENASGTISGNNIKKIRTINHTGPAMAAIHVTSGFDNSVNVHHNFIDSFYGEWTGPTEIAGIYFMNMSRINVTHNHISNIFNVQSGNFVSGIYYAYVDSSLISNNQIYLSSPIMLSTATAGILHDDPNPSLYNRICNNTILISGRYWGSIRRVYNIYLKNANAQVFNNLLYNKGIDENGPTYHTYALGLENMPAKLSNVMGYNLMVVNDSTKAFSINGVDYGPHNLSSLFAPLGQTNTNTNWIERTDRLPAHLLFEDTVTGDLDIRTDNDACWYANGKGLALADIADDIHGDTRSTSISGGTTDIGADEFAPDNGVLPHALSVNATTSGLKKFMFAGRTVAQITIAAGSGLPTSAQLRYYSGVAAPSLLPGADHFNAYHDLTIAGSGYAYSMEPMFDSASLGTVPNAASIRLAVNQGSWVYAGGGASFLPGLYSHASGISFTGSALFTGTTATNPLPVKLLTFSGIKQNKDVLLNWKTASEINTDVFVVERSYNGKTFEAIGEVKAKGNTSSTTSYQFTDKNVRADQTIYYRLNIKDHNGYAEHSKTVMIDVQQKVTSIQVYPNPSASNFFVQVNSAQSSAAKITLYDMTGRVVQSLETLLNKGSNDIEIETSYLQPGVYFVFAEISGERLKIKVIKQ